MKKIGFFQELHKDGYIKLSIMRLMCFLSFCIGSIYALSLFYTRVKNSLYEIAWFDVVIVGLFLVGAFAPKAFQKFAESKLIK